MDIKDLPGTTRYSTPINEGSKRKFLLMKDDNITLKFSVATPVYFKLGDYIDCDFGLFELIDIYKPKFNTSTGGYDYELQLDAYYRKWKNKIFKYTQTSQEASWNLTATLDVHLGVFLKDLQALGYKYRGTDFTFSIDSTVSNTAKLVSYDNTNMLDALTMLAEAWECEWWVTDNIIHFGRCEFGTAVDFEIGENVEEMTRDESSSTFATRVVAFGAAKNLPTNYRPTDENATINGVVQKRLMLPADTPYVDAYEGMSTEEAVEQVVIFDDIFPRTQCTVGAVTTYTSTATNDDGTHTTETYYRFLFTGFNFSESYILEGEELKIKFDSGLLNGMEFGAKFNPLAEPEKSGENWNPDAQIFELVISEDYGRKLPDSILHPSIGDKFILSGWDSTKITELGLIDSAEQELKERTEKYVEKSKIDPSTYRTKMLIQSGDALYELGDKVKLINAAFFETGSRESRIIGFEYNLDIPTDHPIYTVGETASYSRLGEIESKLDEVTYKGQTYNGGNGSGIYLIRTHDNAPASDSNAFSAKRAIEEFVSALNDDTAAGLITFLQGLQTGGAVDDFNNGKGVVITPDGRVQADKLEARYAAIFREVIFNRLSAQEGDTAFTDSGLVESVTLEADGTYTLKLRKRWDNDFTSLAEHDVIYGDVNNLFTTGEYYTSWMRVLSVNTTANTISCTLYPDDECPGSVNHAPTELMRLVHRGNAVNTDRQSYWALSATTDKCLVWLEGVTKPIIEDKNYYMIAGKLKHLAIFDNLPISYTQAGFYARSMVYQNQYRVNVQGVPVKDILPGIPWVDGDTYTSSDTEAQSVYHYGCRWQCIADSTTQEPQYGCTDWAMIEGNPQFTIEINSTNLYEFDPDEIETDVVFTTLQVTGKIYNRDCTDNILDADVSWTRDSGNVTEDNAWAVKRASAGKDLTLTGDDIRRDNGNKYIYTFRATVTLRDGQTATDEIYF